MCIRDRAIADDTGRVQPLWHSLLTYIRDRDLLVEGPLNALRGSHVALTKPETLFDRRAFLLGTRLSSRYRPSECVVHPTEGAANGAQRGAPPAPPPAAAAPPTGAPPARPAFLPTMNPFAAAPILAPQGMLTQDAMSIGQLSEQGMSLAAFGQLGGYLSLIHI